MQIWGVVVAGGTGTRFGGPKQVATLAGRRVIDRSIDALRHWVDGLVVVGAADVGTAERLSVDAVVDGGSSRSDSVRRGLTAVPRSASHVLIHDAARPLVPDPVVARVVEALAAGSVAVVPVVPVTDTLRSVEGGTIDRSKMVAVQTPQGFDVAVLRSAHERGLDGTDDASVVEAAGAPVDHVTGSALNLKVTFPHDLAVAEALIGMFADEPSIDGSVAASGAIVVDGAVGS